MKKMLALLLSSLLVGCAGGFQEQMISFEKVNVVWCDGEGFARVIEQADYLVFICDNEAKTKAVIERHH